MSSAQTDVSVLYTNREKLLTAIGTSIGFFFDTYTLFITSYMLVALENTFHASLAQVALAVSLPLYASIIGGVIFGYLGDLWGRRTTMLITIVMFGIFTFVTGFAPSLVWIYVLRILAGLGIGGEWGLGSSLANEAWGAKNRGTMSGILQSMSGVAIIAGALTAGYTIATYGPLMGWRYAYEIAGVAALVLVSFRFFMPESKQWLKYMELKKKGQLPPNYRTTTPLKDIFSKSTIKWVIFGSLLAGANFFYTQANLFAPTYFAQVAKIPIVSFTQMITLGGVLTIIAMWILGFMSDRIGRKTSNYIYVGCTFVFVLAYAYILWTGTNLYEGNIWTPLIFGYLLVTFFNGFSGTIPVWLGELFPTRERATGSNFDYSIGRMIGATAPLLIPLLVPALGGLGRAMAVGLIIGVVMYLLAVIGLKETKGTQITPV